MKAKIKMRVVAGVFALLLIAVYTIMSITGTGNPETEEAFEDLKNKEASGFFIFIELLDRMDYQISEWKHPDRFPDNGVLILLKNSSDYKRRNKREILNWVQQGNILIQAQPSETIDILTGFRLENIYNTKKSNVWFTSNLENNDIGAFLFESSQIFVEDDNAKVYASNDQGSLIVGRLEEAGEIISFADNYFFTNFNTASVEISTFINSLISKYYNKKFYYVGVKGLQAKLEKGNPFLILFAGRLKYITLHLLFFMFVYFLSIGLRFGPPDLPTVSKQRFLRRHLAGMGNFFEKVKAASFVLQTYKNYFRHRFLHYYSMPYNSSNEVLILKIRNNFPEYGPEIENFFSANSIQTQELIHIRNLLNKILKDLKSKG